MKKENYGPFFSIIAQNEEKTRLFDDNQNG